jgi:hypothetical protein
MCVNRHLDSKRRPEARGQKVEWRYLIELIRNIVLFVLYALNSVSLIQMRGNEMRIYLFNRFGSK